MSIIKTRWFAVAVTCVPEAVEAVESAFNDLEAAGTSTDGLRKKADESRVVHGYFVDAPASAVIRLAMNGSLDLYGLGHQSVSDISVGEVEQTDWLAEWKKHWSPSTIGRFIIAPPWSDVHDDGKIVIRIEPNMAFGTGTHETTQLCLAAIDQLLQPGDSFLDVGTGTGVLAIAAAKLGGRVVNACDVDIDSVAIARQNAVLNGVVDRITFSEGSIGQNTEPHNFVCANLTLDVILPILPLLLAKARRMLVMSGILGTQEEGILSELDRLEISRPEVFRAGEWISVIVRADRAF